jgi:Cu-Zn family superoxide dismutase
MKTLVTTTIIAMALCAACAHKETTQPENTVAGSTATTAPAAPQGPTSAQATLIAAKKQKVKGSVHFTQVGDKVKVEATLTGLKPGPHGFHIHEKGDCSAKDFASAGGHFNPTQVPHGGVDAAEHHAGDMGNIVADKKGKATYTAELSNMQLGGEYSIVGKAIVIHEKADDFKTQPSGDSGSRIACGVIETGIK